MQKIIILHDSHQKKYRSPFGAVSCQTDVKLAIDINADCAIDSVYLRLWRDGKGEELKEMLPVSSDGQHVRYAVTIEDLAEPGLVWYYFIVHSEETVYYYGNNDRQKGGLGAISFTAPPSYQITVHLPESVTPEWFKHAVVYQIFPDRFYNGQPGGKVLNPKKGSLLHAFWDNDPVYVREQETGRILAYDFFGGNLAGIIAKLTYLKELGISAIYLNPVFESVSNHRYDTADYKKIDPMLGDNDTFQSLCEKADELGIAVILDGVFSHTGSDSVYFNKDGRYPELGAYQSEDSPYYSWYRFTKYPDEYESWWGVDALPNVNEMDSTYRNYIISDSDSVVKYWLTMGAKGWRLDVADELPDEFIRELRQSMKTTDKDSVLIGEVWEDASNKVSYDTLRRYLLGDELDSPTNYPFRSIALNFLLGRMDATAVNQSLMSMYENYPLQNFYAALNVIGSHDVPRILTLLGGHEGHFGKPYGWQLTLRLTEEERQTALARLKLLVLWQMTFPGVPHIYYGDEAGLEGYTDPLNRRTFPWGREDKNLQAWYKKLIKLRNEHPFLRTGSWQPLECGPDILGYIRLTDQGKDIFDCRQENNFAAILINRSLQEITCEVDFSSWHKGMVFDCLHDERELAVGSGKVTMKLAPLSGRVLLSHMSGKDKKCGILLHPTSLSSNHGIGGLGKEAFEFLDFLGNAGQKCWQILPLNPIGYGNSPYQSVSALACETLLIDPDLLITDNLLTAEEVAEASKRYDIRKLPSHRVDYETVKKYKQQLFHSAFKQFKKRREEEYEAFINFCGFWLNDYALYMALANYFEEESWILWPQDVASRQAEALTRYSKLLADEIDYYKFLQYIFHKQWVSVKKYAKAKGISIIGDMPIFIAHYSADVWTHPELFKLDGQGRPKVVAGVPPDYFSKTGQLWGNPLYNWRRMAEDNYCWWRERFLRLLELTDLVRIDHFRGFAAYWQVPAGALTAENGQWIKGPGTGFFKELEKSIGQLPVIAEDLGVITSEVTALRQKFQFPGMKVLQFAFPEGQGHEDAALECERDTVVYTGTHDNNTTLGWYKQRLNAGDTAGIDAYLALSPNTDPQEVPWRMIELAYQSKASTAIIPLQDILALDETARMNTPGTVGGNWEWRAEPGSISPKLAERLALLAEKHQRRM